MSTFDDMVNFLDVSYAAKDQIVPCLIGPVGIGKTAAVYQHAKNVNAGKVVTIIASQILPNEVSGITMPVHESKAMEIYDHYRLSSLNDGDILFFDELLEADQLVLSACLTLIESRQMMSGKKLPDIQIIAATNPTIKASMLKENIRQRFVFRNFSVDRIGCHDYIKDTYGLDLPNGVIDQIDTSSDDYNTLSPRSLTKMVHWISTADTKDEAESIAEQINVIWQSSIGTALMRAWLIKQNDPQEQCKKAIRETLKSNNVGFDNIFADDAVFEGMTMTELIESLKKLPEWDEIERQLSNIELVEEDCEEEITY